MSNQSYKQIEKTEEESTPTPDEDILSLLSNMNSSPNPNQVSGNFKLYELHPSGKGAALVIGLGKNNKVIVKKDIVGYQNCSLSISQCNNEQVKHCAICTEAEFEVHTVTVDDNNGAPVLESKKAWSATRAEICEGGFTLHAYDLNDDASVKFELRKFHEEQDDEIKYVTYDNNGCKRNNAR